MPCSRTSKTSAFVRFLHHRSLYRKEHSVFERSVLFAVERWSNGSPFQFQAFAPSCPCDESGSSEKPACLDVGEVGSPAGRTGQQAWSECPLSTFEYFAPGCAAHRLLRRQPMLAVDQKPRVRPEPWHFILAALLNHFANKIPHIRAFHIEHSGKIETIREAPKAAMNAGFSTCDMRDSMYQQEFRRCMPATKAVHGSIFQGCLRHKDCTNNRSICVG